MFDYLFSAEGRGEGWRSHQNMMNIIIVAGLGNPGKAYENTPHNAGFNVVEELAKRRNCRLRRSFRLQACTARIIVSGREVLLLKPATYMNNSGSAVAAALKKTGGAASSLVVVVDDADLELGRLRIRRTGSDGGHNGLKSIIAHIGRSDFIRVRIGIGRNDRSATLAEHVLKPLGKSAQTELKSTVASAADAVLMIIEQGAEKTMNAFNARGDGRNG